MEERKINDQTIKADAGKLRLSLVPTELIRSCARVREYGLKKYGEKESWRKVEFNRYIDALFRHVLAFVDNPCGKDEESGLLHLDHVICNAAFLIEKLKTRSCLECEYVIDDDEALYCGKEKE